MTTANFELVRNAHVEVKQGEDNKHRPLALITVDGKYKHTFPHTSRVSKHLEMMTPDDLSHRLSGGNFFFVENQLVDFRDGSYHGFVHDDNTVNVFMDVLGYQYRNGLKLAHIAKKSTDEDSPIVLRKIWDRSEISVPGYQSGGDFNSVLSFTWNPFVKTVNTMFDLVRLICTNGMVGLTSFLNTRVPVMNRWEEHLDIAARQIQHKVNNVVISRVQQMTLERASVGDCLLLEEHVLNRIQHAELDDVDRLYNILGAISPKEHLGDVYRDNVFLNKNLAAQLPAHLSGFDVFNIATELRTHTNPSSKSSDNALDRFANGILFDREDNYNASAKRLNAPRIAAFSDPETAFFGKVAA